MRPELIDADGPTDTLSDLGRVIEGIGGSAPKGRRDNVVLDTKAHVPMGDDPNQRGNSRRWLTREVEDSLRRLQTDQIVGKALAGGRRENVVLAMKVSLPFDEAPGSPPWIRSTATRTPSMTTWRMPSRFSTPLMS